VQEKVNQALSLLLGEDILTTGAGRTDTGVHAQMFCFHFDSTNEDLASDNNLVFRLNGFLPDDICITYIRKVIPEANARFSAISRTYKYYITMKKDPFNMELSWFLYGSLDIAAMNYAADILLRHTDFTSFSKLHSGNKTNFCRIYHARWEESYNSIIFTIRADRFLRNMVRAIVGTMVDIGHGKITAVDFENIIIAKNRSLAGMSAPAKGLFLTEIEYPEQIFI
jgi:tRNA pseudouridine38-40 synthase